ncbi:urea ABC transporter permease subunit UrtC, partial [Rhizobium leguminosarum]|nr:urea ABC transporter permease subunit UrtC [Rhizobium leguminosarum]
AILVNGGKTIFTGLFPEFWLFALGGLFVAVTLFLPKGVVGTIAQYLGKRKKVSNSAPPAAQEDGIEPKIQAAE